MTTTFFMVLLIIACLVLLFGCTLILADVFDNFDAGFICAFLITFVFVAGFSYFTPSTAQMIENDYYAMLDDRPKCIDASNVSLGCKEEYIDWQRDSIDAQRKYDSVKVVLDNKQKEILK